MKNRKGFTIVELVIVIAVIAILAAVLIPTFSGVVQKANDSAALQTARSTLTNALNMSSTAQLSGQRATKEFTTMIVVDGHAYGYTGNELQAIDYPNAANKVFKTVETSGQNSFNSILIAAENLVDSTTQKSVAEATPAEGATLTIKNVNAIINKFDADSNKLGCTEFENIGVTYVNGHYYLNYTAATETVDASWDTEIYVNSDFSNKVVVFTTFG